MDLDDFAGTAIKLILNSALNQRNFWLRTVALLGTHKWYGVCSEHPAELQAR